LPAKRRVVTAPAGDVTPDTGERRAICYDRASGVAGLPHERRGCRDHWRRFRGACRSQTRRPAWSFA